MTIICREFCDAMTWLSIVSSFSFPVSLFKVMNSLLANLHNLNTKAFYCLYTNDFNFFRKIFDKLARLFFLYEALYIFVRHCILNITFYVCLTFKSINSKVIIKFWFCNPPHRVDDGWGTGQNNYLLDWDHQLSWTSLIFIPLMHQDSYFFSD